MYEEVGLNNVLIFSVCILMIDGIFFIIFEGLIGSLIISVICIYFVFFLSECYEFLFFFVLFVNVDMNVGFLIVLL